MLVGLTSFSLFVSYLFPTWAPGLPEASDLVG